MQYKIIHRMISTNKKLYLYGIKDSNKCEKCEEEEETITHLFCDCPKTWDTSRMCKFYLGTRD